MTNRNRIKSIIKKLVLNEITKADYGVGKVSTNTEFVRELNKLVQKEQGDVCAVSENPLNNKISFDDGRDGAKFQVELTRKTDNGEVFDVVAIFQGSERFVGKNLSKDDVREFIKDNLVGDEPPCLSYVEKALAKGKAPITKKDDKKKDTKKDEEKEESDEMEDSEEVTQLDTADKATKDAEEELDVDDLEDSPELGGEIVAKIERIIDKVLNGKQTKAEPKTAFLKADKDKESPDELTIKAKETPKLKEKKSLKEGADPINPPIGLKSDAFRVHIPANVYDGKYYDHRTYQLLVAVTDETKTEQDAINWVNSHKPEVLKRIDRARTGGKRYVPLPLEKNVFFKDKYYVKKTQIG